WQVTDCYKAKLANITETHTINPLLVYEIDYQLIPPAKYENKLCGAIIEVHFSPSHQKSKHHIFNTILHEMIVLQPPSNMSSSLLLVLYYQHIILLFYLPLLPTWATHNLVLFPY
ncbi:hypothetical protein P692DRAFT_20735436, partial [Suillus brevipes Sb2]